MIRRLVSFVAVATGIVRGLKQAQCPSRCAFGYTCSSPQVTPHFSNFDSSPVNESRAFSDRM